MSDFNPHKAVDFIIATAPKFAKAKAERVYLEQFRSSKNALLMGQSQAKASVEREQHAYAPPEYVQLLDGLRAAVEIEEHLKWELVAAQARIEVYRTQEASARAEVRATQ
ncbi:MAG: hypothetical protein HEQ39_09935 [Rhizobacter sp.]